MFAPEVPRQLPMALEQQGLCTLGVCAWPWSKVCVPWGPAVPCQGFSTFFSFSQLSAGRGSVSDQPLLPVPQQTKGRHSQLTSSPSQPGDRELDSQKEGRWNKNSETPGNLLPKLLEHPMDMVYIPSELPAASWRSPGSMNLLDAISFWGGF